ncbi:Os09g0392400, partial [Oryza sativa Japonica Group]
IFLDFQCSINRETISFILHGLSLPNWILRFPYSFIEAVVWSCVVYYTVGFAPMVDRYTQDMYPFDQYA